MKRRYVVLLFFFFIAHYDRFSSKPVVVVVFVCCFPKTIIIFFFAHQYLKFYNSKIFFDPRNEPTRFYFLPLKYQISLDSFAESMGTIKI
jgi:hypothetical protein